MNTITRFMKKMASFFCLTILFFFNSSLNAQIIYTDIPDLTPNATYALDLNNDSIDDFIIQFDLSDKVMCKPLNNNAYSGGIISGLHLPWALSQSNSICDTLVTWYDSSNPGIMSWGTNIGFWVGESDKYLALKLIVGTNTYYGWVRLDVSATSTSFTIKDYAYESTPNACIQTGQISLGIHENITKNVFSIFPNPFGSTATIQTNGNLKNATLTICNTYGQIVNQIIHITGKQVHISRNNLPSGLYFILLTEENKIMAVEKLVIID